MDSELEDAQRKKSASSHMVKLYLVLGLLGAYALVLTVYILAANQATVTSEIKNTTTVQKFLPVAKDADGDSEGGDVTSAVSGVDSKDPTFTPEIDNLVKEVLPKEDFRMVKTGWRITKELMNPKHVGMSAIVSFASGILTAAVIILLGYLGYLASQNNSPLLSPEMIKTVQNYSRLIMAISSGGLLIAGIVTYIDGGKRLHGAANLSVIFFGLVCVACCFIFTFAELTMNAQSLVLPEVHDGLFTGKTASSVMTWVTSFLQVNMSTLGSGLLLMWIAHFIADWALKAAEGTKFHKACSILALPMVTFYMSARRSSNFIHTIFRVALTIISFAMTINLLTPD